MIADKELDRGMLILKVIWFAMLMSLVFYLLIGLFIVTDLQTSMNKDSFNMFRIVLYIVAFITLIITRFIRKFVLSWKGPYKRFSQFFRHPVLQKYSSVVIIGFAMSESIGVYGLLLFFLGKNPVDLYLLILVSAAAIVMYRPKKEELLNLAQESQLESMSGGKASFNEPD